jgi:nicotinamidase-related amidase
VLVDVQKDFVARARNPDGLVRNCRLLLAVARKERVPIFHVRRSYRRDGLDVELPRLKRFIESGWMVEEGSDGARPPAGLEDCEGEIVVVKPRWSAFFQTELDLMLRRLGVSTLVIAGLQTPNCIRATAFDAIALDYGAIVVSDATSAATASVHASNLADMGNVGAAILSTQAAAKAFRGGRVSDGP